MSVAGVPLTPGQVALLLLGLGAVMALLLTPWLSSRPALAAGLGLVVVAAAGWAGLGVGLAIPALCLVAALALLLVPSLELQESEHVAESVALVLLATLGGGALALAGDLLQAVVGLETLALSAATLVALSRGPRALEAAFKYFVLGAISLASLLFGVGLVYLGTGSFAFPTATQAAGSGLVLAGVALITLGIAFELAVFPFHWGALDAYTVAAPGLAGLVMSASKLAAAYALGLLVAAAGAPAAQVLVWVGTATIAWGTFGALAQRELRRLLAYSAVTHAGFIALAAGSGPNGPAVAQFYAILYAAMALLVFAALAGLRRPDGEIEAGLPLDRLGSLGLGLGRGAALALGLFALSGIPPTPGFWAKLAVLAAAWQHAGPLATLVAVAGGVFSVLYYLRPLPDLFASLRAGTAGAGAGMGASVGRVAPALLLAAALVLVLSLAPGLAWR